jgi:hypothetical protein
MRGKAGLFSRFQPFSPTSLAGLTGWWDASDASTLFDDSSNGSPSTADGQVGRIEDKSGSGNGRHFTTAPSSVMPIRKISQQNGRDVVRFDGVNDLMGTSQAFSSFVDSSQGTVFVVCKATAVDTNSGTQPSNDVVLTEAGGAHGFVMLRSDDTAAAFGFGVSPFAYTTASLTYVPGSWKVFSTLHDGTDLAFHINSGSPATGALATRNFMGSSLVLGANNNVSQFFDGDVGEIITYNVALSSGDRVKVETYLMNKWGIS